MTILNSHLPTITEPETIADYSGDEKRIRFLKRGLLLGVVSEMLFLLLSDIRSGVKITIINDLVTSSIFLTIYVGSFLSKKHKLLFNLTILAIALSTIISLYDISATRTIFLTPITVLVAYLLLARIGGIIWTLLISMASLSAYLLDRYSVLKVNLDPQLVIFGVISTVLVSILLYVYEGVNVVNEELISKRDRELSILNLQLNQQLAYNKHTADELTVTLDNSQKNNKILSDTKKAIMNILEDTNELQKQLKQEKEGIEQTVLERTDQLRKEQARLRASINSLGIGFLMTFQDNQEAILNPAIQILFGKRDGASEEKQFSNSSYISFIQERLGNNFDLLGAIKKSQQTTEPFSVESIELDKKFISIAGAPIMLSGQKEAIGCVVLIEDKTEAMLLERSKDEFISIASHELRTPLTAIRGNASMLATIYSDQLPDGDVKSMVSDIKDASVRLIGIVNQFLSTSRLEQKRAIFTLVPVDITRSIIDNVRRLQELANERNLNLTADIPNDLPHVLADDARTGEVIVNVVGNAIKYTNSGSVKVTARVIEGFVEVNVEDTGIGIEAKNQPLLFHKFQQATSNILTRDDSRSTGLGLYITKLLVEQMGGDIYLKHSELGKGSTFTFTLPIATEISR